MEADEAPMRVNGGITGLGVGEVFYFNSSIG